MFFLFRLHHDDWGRWEQLVEVDFWEQMVYVIQQHFHVVQVIEYDKYLPDRNAYEIAFEDEDGDIYVIVRTNGWWRSRNEYDDYGDYYDDIDRQADSYYAQQRREVEKWEYIFRNPDLLMKKYCPQPKLIEANRKNEWYVGALND